MFSSVRHIILCISCLTSTNNDHVSFTELLEMLLLLVWRHLGIYGADQFASGSHDLALNLNLSIRLPQMSSFDGTAFRAEAGRKLGPVLHRMTTMVSVDLLIAMISLLFPRRAHLFSCDLSNADCHLVWMIGARNIGPWVGAI